MSTASATVTLPAATLVEVIDELIESESISIGARGTAYLALVVEARRRGFDPALPIDGDVLDTLVIDAIPRALWLHA